MTPREMTAEDVARALKMMRAALGPGMGDALAGHVAALRARAEAAEADNAAKDEAFRLYVEERGVEHDDIPGTEIPCPEDDTCECPRIVALNAAFRTGNPGTGYRAKVRAELLRELAKEQREAAETCRESMPERAAHHEATADGYEGQASREEQG